MTDEVNCLVVDDIICTSELLRVVSKLKVEYCVSHVWEIGVISGSVDVY